MTEINRSPKIIFEDEDVLVIDKPAGLMVHEDGFSDQSTVVDWFLSHYPQAKGVGELGRSPKGKNLERSGVVHRLDRETSGVMVLAKTAEAFTHLKQQFQDRLVKKEYQALVYGRLKESRGKIERPIGRNARDFRLRSAQRGAKGTVREAVTYWERLGEGEYKNEIFSHLRLLPKTGRTHQLRVHLKAIDHPIVGDTLYAGKKCEQSNNLDLNRLALHSTSLELVLPNSASRRFEVPLPDVLLEAIRHIAPVV